MSPPPLPPPPPPPPHLLSRFLYSSWATEVVCQLPLKDAEPPYQQTNEHELVKDGKIKRTDNWIRDCKTDGLMERQTDRRSDKRVDILSNYWTRLSMRPLIYIFWTVCKRRHLVSLQNFETTTRMRGLEARQTLNSTQNLVQMLGSHVNFTRYCILTECSPPIRVSQ